MKTAGIFVSVADVIHCRFNNQSQLKKVSDFMGMVLDPNLLRNWLVLFLSLHRTQLMHASSFVNVFKTSK